MSQETIPRDMLELFLDDIELALDQVLSGVSRWCLVVDDPLRIIAETVCAMLLSNAALNDAGIGPSGGVLKGGVYPTSYLPGTADWLIDEWEGQPRFYLARAAEDAERIDQDFVTVVCANREDAEGFTTLLGGRARNRAEMLADTEYGLAAALGRWEAGDDSFAREGNAGWASDMAGKIAPSRAQLRWGMLNFDEGKAP